GRGVRNLADAPRRIDEIPHVQYIEAQLELVARATRPDTNLLQNSQVDVLVPRIELAEPVRDLTPMGAQVAVLADESIQPVPLLLRRYDNATREGVGQENNLALVAWDVDEIVPALAVAVHVAGIDE